MKKKKEIRYHSVKTIDKKGRKKSIPHPAYVFLEKDDIYIYVTITHSNHVDGMMVIKLKKNPNPKDDSDSYFVASIMQDTKDSFGKKRNGWLVDDSDDLLIRELYLKTKNKKR